MLTVIMTAQEQLMIELVNRTRANPTAEAALYGLELNTDIDPADTISPEAKQPLAPNQALTIASGLHAEDMLVRDFFAHDTPEGVSPSDRARRAGYPSGAGENIARAPSAANNDAEVYARHADLFRSTGHRINMLRSNWREIGAGVRYGSFSTVTEDSLASFPSIMVGTLFGNRGGNKFITGVAINDQIVFNGFYEIGEGLANVKITATQVGTGAEFSDITGPSGGYGFQVPNGTYTVTAEGGGLPGPISVGGIVVSDVNVKVDFTFPWMPTSAIAGAVFQDNNGNGTREPDEPFAAGNQVYLDLDENGLLGPGDPRVLTDANGRFRFDGYLPGSYVVQQVPPTGWTATAPAGTIHVNLIPDRDVESILFGAQPGNAPPVTSDDESDAFSAVPVLIDVLANDFDSDGALVPGTIQITAPANGTAKFDPISNQIEYVSRPGFGVDSFQYSVADDQGSRSELTNVLVHVKERPVWRNAAAPMDVNGDGVVVSTDAVVVIRELNRVGSEPLAGRAKDSAGPPYYDVNGDDYLTSLDAVQVIRFLHQQRLAEQAAGEPPTPTTTTAADVLFASRIDLAAALLDEE